jgi:oligopeptide/dipeptide ABC transporter ATP-binding protein
VRGAELAIVFQEPLTALDPVLTVGAQLAAALRAHRSIGRAEARARARAALAEVGLDAAGAYPHELSGGMRQRALLALALVLEPKLLVADEPTSALDVTLQAHVLALLARRRAERGMALLIVTHDLRVAARAAGEVAVMYAGRIVERARAAELYAAPRHPYTAGLVRSLPERAAPRTRLAAIPGQVPPPGALPSGCRYRTRCELARERCAASEPALAPVGPVAEGAAAARRSACHFPFEVSP